MEDTEIYQKVPTLEENNITSFCHRTPTSYMGITSPGNVVNYAYLFFISMYSRHLLIQEQFKDNKAVIGICQWKDRQHNGRKEKDKITNND